jgi:hypothetical protein
LRSVDRKHTREAGDRVAAEIRLQERAQQVVQCTGLSRVVRAGSARTGEAGQARDNPLLAVSGGHNAEPNSKKLLAFM